MGLLAIFTQPGCQHIGTVQAETLWQLHLWRYNVLQAISYAAIVANKMHMVIVVMTFAAFVFAQRISHHAVRRRNGMKDTAFLKGLQRAVNGNAVELFACFFLNYGMFERPGAF